MALYYTRLHPAGPISCCPFFTDVESISPAIKDSPESGSNANTLRSLKHMWTLERGCSLTQAEGVSIKSSPHSDDGCTDKKLLLENWIARSGSPMFASAPISQDPDNLLEDIEFHTVVNSPDNSFDKGIVNEGYKATETEKQKRRGICSPTDLGLKLSQLSEDEFAQAQTGNTLKCQKRRGICSSDQLVIDLNDINLTNSSEVNVNLNDDVKLKRRPIYSVGAGLHSYNSELSLKSIYSNKLMKICCDDKSVCSSGSLKPEEYMEMSSEVLSAHDYENICAVNIARERWGLRSWEGYTDIETFLHDDSTVRDRRRDTLTSTMTGTSASSEISSSDTANSPPPLIPNRRPRNLRSRQDDYLDTLIYDLVDCDKRRVHFLDCTEDHEIESNVFTAKPYVVDQHGMFFPLGSTLEPIEELEEPTLTPDKVPSRKPRSALVATIDEIRRGTETDSPRNVYHRTETIWDDDLQVQEIIKNASDIVRNKSAKAPPSVVKALWTNTTKLDSPPKLPLKMSNTNDTSKLDIEDKLNIIKSSLPKPKCEALSKPETDYNNEENKRHKAGNKPRRKFSLLREKFEPKVKQTETFEMGSTVNLIDDLKAAKYTPPVITKVVQWNNIIRNQNKNNENCEGHVSGSDQENDETPFHTFRDKRNVFLKQVLSPPKFNNRNKKINPK